MDSTDQGVARMPLNSKGPRAGDQHQQVSLVSADEIWLLVSGMEMSKGTERNTKREVCGGQESQALRTEAEEEPGKRLKINKSNGEARGE